MATVGKKAAGGGGAGGAGAAKKKVQRQYSAVELGDYLIGSVVFIREPEKEELYVKATVKSINGTQLTVDVDGATKTVDVSDCLNANVGIDPSTVVDLSKLPHANEACALEVLRERYVRDLIYVSPTLSICSSFSFALFLLRALQVLFLLSIIFSRSSATTADVDSFSLSLLPFFLTSLECLYGTGSS